MLAAGGAVVAAGGAVAVGTAVVAAAVSVGGAVVGTEMRIVDVGETEADADALALGEGLEEAGDSCARLPRKRTTIARTVMRLPATAACGEKCSK